MPCRPGLALQARPLLTPSVTVLSRMLLQTSLLPGCTMGAGGLRCWGANLRGSIGSETLWEAQRSTLRASGVQDLVPGQEAESSSPSPPAPVTLADFRWETTSPHSLTCPNLSKHPGPTRLSPVVRPSQSDKQPMHCPAPSPPLMARSYGDSSLGPRTASEHPPRPVLFSVGQHHGPPGPCPRP